MVHAMMMMGVPMDCGPCYDDDGGAYGLWSML